MGATWQQARGQGEPWGSARLAEVTEGERALAARAHPAARRGSGARGDAACPPVRPSARAAPPRRGGEWRRAGALRALAREHERDVQQGLPV